MTTTRDNIKADARQRAARTLLQGAAVAVVVGVATAAAEVVDDWTGAELVDASSWGALGTAAALAGLQALAAWVHAHLVPAITGSGSGEQ